MTDEDGGVARRRHRLLSNWLRPIAGRLLRFRTDRRLYTEVNLVATVQNGVLGSW